MSRRGFLRAAAGTAAVSGATGTAVAQEGSGGGTQTVNLVDYAYEPGTDEPLYIAPGTTVNFVWETNTHNIVVDSQPSGAGWEGYETIENAGFEYSHTFETTGEYAFHCQPHLNLGMEGTIIVNEQGAPPDAGGGGGPAVPDSAKTLGIATSVGLAAILGLAYVFLKYGGGDRHVESE